MKHKPSLLPEFLNGPFGDPALAIWLANGTDGMLIDCGDLSRFTSKKLLQVNAIFLSHCHVDHFFGFDAFLRVHIGLEKTILIFGPPDTSLRVSGKLQGYTWNLIQNDNTQFAVIDLDPTNRKKTTTYFRSQDCFHPSKSTTEAWDPTHPIHSTSAYLVKTALLDHRTPSLAYAVEEQPSYSANGQRIKELGIKEGAWIQKLKDVYVKKNFDNSPSVNSAEHTSMEVPLVDGTSKKFNIATLGDELLIQRSRHKIVYATDGGTSDTNRQSLLRLVREADLMFSETCFLPEDQKLADKTKHFTTEFIAKLAQEAGVKKLSPFHFSKRYKDRPEQVLSSISEHFLGEIVPITLQY